MRKIVTIIGVFLVVLTTQAQKKNAKVNIEVEGVCLMCKDRIEKAALKIKGVKFANWDLSTHQLSLIVDERKTNKDIISEKVAAVGHDTKVAKAPQEAYDSLHSCCKYRDEEIQESHKKH